MTEVDEQKIIFDFDRRSCVDFRFSMGILVLVTGINAESKN
jgi:hypothetical protein